MPEAIFFYAWEKPFPKTRFRTVEDCFAGEGARLAMTKSEPIALFEE
jgi:hypothetical protein